MPQQEFTDAIGLLKADHCTVEDLFQKFCSASNKDRKLALAQQICNELKIHAQIEEKILYPAFDGKIDEDLLRESYVEHDGAKILINDIMENGANDAFFEAKVTVLCEEIQHHVKEEEKPAEGMFAQCRQTGVDLVALRDEMLALKEQLQAKAENGGLPRAELATVQLQPA